VPAPTFCPDCRLRRRLTFRNERKLYKRKCDFSNKDIISIYHKESPYKVYDQKIWWSDKWDPMEYGREYDFKRPFFEQFKELMREVPVQELNVSNNQNCNYCSNTGDSKNCYLVFGSTFCENLMFADRCVRCKDCLDLYLIDKGELCYESLFCRNCFKLFFSKYCEDCSDSTFLLNCRNCQSCFGCVNLRHKQYCIFNTPYTKKDYYQKIKELNLGSYSNLINIKKEFGKFSLEYPYRYAYIIKSKNIVGDNILYPAKDCFYCFETTGDLEDCKYVTYAGYQLKDSYDCFASGINAELLYEIIVGIISANSQCCVELKNSYNIRYSMVCHSSSNLFACVGLRHKKYCILNKQYTKEEYNELVPKIIEHMNKQPYVDKKGRIYKYGEFFPIELSPFAYNETIANEYFPLTKEQALKQGYSWYDKPKNEYKPTIKAKDLPDNIKDANNSILKEVIECDSKQCVGSNVFRIIPQELKFYKKMNLPLPRLCPDCRHRERIKQRNPLKLWKRQCMNKGCSNKFQTTYAPDRPEIVYCEECYLKEVG